jgi:hypothetical protein
MLNELNVQEETTKQNYKPARQKHPVICAARKKAAAPKKGAAAFQKFKTNLLIYLLSYLLNRANHDKLR